MSKAAALTITQAAAYLHLYGLDAAVTHLERELLQIPELESLCTDTLLAAQAALTAAHHAPHPLQAAVAQLLQELAGPCSRVLVICDPVATVGLFAGATDARMRPQQLPDLPVEDSAWSSQVRVD